MGRTPQPARLRRGRRVARSAPRGPPTKFASATLALRGGALRPLPLPPATSSFLPLPSAHRNRQHISYACLHLPLPSCRGYAWQKGDPNTVEQAVAGVLAQLVQERELEGTKSPMISVAGRTDAGAQRRCNAESLKKAQSEKCVANAWFAGPREVAAFVLLPQG